MKFPLPWKKALRLWFPWARTETDRTKLFKQLRRAKLREYYDKEKHAGIPSFRDDTAEVIAKWKAQGVDEYSFNLWKAAIPEWRQERDRAQRQAASRSRWNKKCLAPVKSVKK
jgi:hypothetical protein